MDDWKSGIVSGLRGDYQISMYIRRYLFQKYNHKCARCGWKEMNSFTNIIPLEVEHIDGNYKNNREDNLILLCPNCHSLTATYKGANLNNGRKTRSKYLF
jgi:5-methylcytosine-specific restriction endonuclease McrA